MKICLSLVKKSSFEATFLKNVNHDKLNKSRKNLVFSWQIIEFLKNLLEFLFFKSTILKCFSALDPASIG